jgi:hypothetical protein
MQRINDETTLMPLSEAVHMLPMPVSLCTLTRWCRNGIQNSHGENIKLRCEFVGGRRATCLKWLNDFRMRTQPLAHVLHPELDEPHEPLVDVALQRRKEQAKELLAELLR